MCWGTSSREVLVDVLMSTGCTVVAPRLRVRATHCHRTDVCIVAEGLGCRMASSSLASRSCAARPCHGDANIIAGGLPALAH